MYQVRICIIDLITLKTDALLPSTFQTRPSIDLVSSQEGVENRFVFRYRYITKQFFNLFFLVKFRVTQNPSYRFSSFDLALSLLIIYNLVNVKKLCWLCKDNIMLKKCDITKCSKFQCLYQKIIFSNRQNSTNLLKS